MRVSIKLLGHYILSLIDIKSHDVSVLFKNVDYLSYLEINPLQLFLLVMKNIRFKLKNA